MLFCYVFRSFWLNAPSFSILRIYRNYFSEMIFLKHLLPPRKKCVQVHCKGFFWRKELMACSIFMLPNENTDWISHIALEIYWDDWNDSGSDDSAATYWTVGQRGKATQSKRLPLWGEYVPLCLWLPFCYRSCSPRISAFCCIQSSQTKLR